ncbi:GntR family transcriptional regulator [Rhizobium sp. CG5]|uniref:GntR family transcriptional regulator n=1 Tax=Rhizobium sp. CG5 TaxID=2726076 RepID=UPI002033950A|nr:GntR family transcriptional regulator [Rhizobium sp. CG5]MCM2477750.1 GntR family transcriptional regulator [Rhizobium sp. CG5]
MSEPTEFPFLPLEDLIKQSGMSQSGNVASKVYTLLRSLIVEVKLLPGRALPEKEVAAILNISKTPVREAIIRLSEEGLLRVVPQGGTFVSTIDVQRYIEACFIRFKLESGAVAEAARRHTFEDLCRLEVCLNQQIAAAAEKDYTQFFLLDEEFHKSIFAAARLAGVWSVVNQAKGEMDRMRHLKRVFAVRRTEEVIDEHRDVLEAIRSANSESAVAAITRHLGSLESKITELSRDPKLWNYIERMNAQSPTKRSPKRGLPQ